MSAGVGSKGRPPHPATVMQKKALPPHPAQVAQKKAQAPHSAHPAQKEAPLAHPATIVQRNGRPRHPAAGQRKSGVPSGAIQRTSIVLGYMEGDPMYKGALEDLDKPGPIIVFDNEGNASPSLTQFARQELAAYEQKGREETTLNIIAHGSPGRLASIKDSDWDGLFGTPQRPGQFDKYLTDRITSVNLYACMALMKRDSDERPIAAKIARWIQANIGGDPNRKISLKTGYTTNSTGEYTKGNPSYAPLDIKGILEGQGINDYLYFCVKGALGKAPHSISDEEWKACREDVHEDATVAAHEVAAEIAELVPDRAWGKGLVPAKVFEIRKNSISLVGGDEFCSKLTLRGYTVASATNKNYLDFPARFILLASLENVADDIRKLFAEAIERITNETGQVIKNSRISGSTEQPSFSFGCIPTVRTDSTVPVTFGFTPPSDSAPSHLPSFSFGVGSSSSSSSSSSKETPATTGFVFNPNDRKS